MTNSRLLSLWPCTLLALTIACGSSSPTNTDPDAGLVGDADAGPTVDPSEELFRPDHIVKVTITLAPADWDVLRNQPEVIGMPKITCGNQPTEKPYTYFPADVTVDGVTVTNVGVRKKGGFGSLSTARPGLKVKATEFTSGQRIFGLKRLTLNNNHQDDTRISQCLGYDLFRQAGVAAPRCNFAHVTVNGEDLGVYSNVETIKKAFLRRHFDDDEGRLYESGGEFLPGRTDGFQPKTNKEAPDCSDLPPVATAIQASDADFPSALGAVVDIDAFTTYWAMEVITDHWDGLANNQNNHFFYHDPTSDKFHFIPWGIDALFTGRARTTRPDSVFACGSLPWRMYDVPETRTLYLAKLRQLLDSVWDESAILAEITRMQTLIEPIADPTSSGDLAARIQNTRDFVSTRKADLLAELDAGPPVWPYAAGEESCRINLGTISGTFSTTWDTLDDFGTGSGTFNGSVGSDSITSTEVLANAGLSGEGQGLIQMLSLMPDGRYAVVLLIIQDPVDVTPGTMALDLVNVAAIMMFYDPVSDTSSGGGLMLNGSVTLTSAMTSAGAAIIGSFNGDVLEL